MFFLAIIFILLTIFIVLNTANSREKATFDNLNKQRPTMPPSEKTTITKTALETLKKRAALAESLHKQLKAAQKAQQAAETKQQESEQAYADLKEEYDLMAADSKAKAITIDSLQKATANHVTKTTKVPKKELNQELVNHVTQTAKTVLFRTWKFIEDALEEEEVTQEVIPYLPVDIGMPVEEFVANYSNVVYEAIKNARTEVQSNGKKRAKGKWNLTKLVCSHVICQKFV